MGLEPGRGRRKGTPAVWQERSAGAGGEPGKPTGRRWPPTTVGPQARAGWGPLAAHDDDHHASPTTCRDRGEGRDFKRLGGHHAQGGNDLL